MPTGNKNNSTNSGNSKKQGNKNAKSGAGLANTVPSVKARDRAKNMDNKRRGDTETFNI